MAHLHRVSTLHPMHPTRRLHERTLNKLFPSPRSTPHTVLAPASSLSLAPYLSSSVLPRYLLDPAIGGRLDASASLASLHLPPFLPPWKKGVEYWEHKSDDRRKLASTHYTAAELKATIRWSREAASSGYLTPPIPAKIGALLSHAEWTATHAPIHPPPAAGHTPVPHSTTAPLTQCKPSPGRLPPFLHHSSPDTHAEQARRARLLMGRSRTGSVRLRFAKPAEAASISPYCTQCSTPSTPILETIPHMLVDCHRHTLARTLLQTATTAMGIPALSLSTILLASLPPPPFYPNNLPHLIRATTNFLSAVHADRAREKLIPLDTG